MGAEEDGGDLADESHTSPQVANSSTAIHKPKVSGMRCARCGSRSPPSRHPFQASANTDGSAGASRCAATAVSTSVIGGVGPVVRMSLRTMRWAREPSGADPGTNWPGPAHLPAGPVGVDILVRMSRQAFTS